VYLALKGGRGEFENFGGVHSSFIIYVYIASCSMRKWPVGLLTLRLSVYVLGKKLELDGSFIPLYIVHVPRIERR
jgi:hypothetical protein